MNNLLVPKGIVYKDIPGYEGKYVVTEYGDVYPYRRNGTNGNKLKTNIVVGYKRVKLSSKNKYRNYFVHRLVGITFLGHYRTDQKDQINHKDGNKLNNYLGNIEWVSRKENIIHAWKNGLYKNRSGENSNLHKLTEKQVKEIRYLLENGSTVSNIRTLYNIKNTAIYKIKLNLSWKYI